MTKFIFVRHGEPDYPSTLDWQKMSLAKNFAGLTEAGRNQIKNTCNELKKSFARVNSNSGCTGKNHDLKPEFVGGNY